MSKFILSFVIVLLPLTSAADILRANSNGRSIEGVPIASSARAEVEDRTYNLRLIGAGVRTKTKLFIEFGVYVAELFAASSADFKRSRQGALASIDAQTAVAIRFTFLRALSGREMRSAFAEGLAANGVSVDEGPIRELLDALGNTDVNEGSTLNIVAEKLENGTEQISFEDAQQDALTMVVGEPGLIRSMFSIWFGRVRDPEVQSLRDQILGLRAQ